MSHQMAAHPSVQQEQVLARKLSAGQQAMIAVGGSIGTGLFLASGAAVPTAGPAVILSNLVIAGISLLLGSALTEMCVAHPAAGSFGLYAEMYVSPFAGYAVRMSYWISQLVAVGGHMIATSIYMRYWFPEVPGVVWIVGFSGLLLYINARAVSTFGSFEYWFSMIKVVAVAVFVVLGVMAMSGLTGTGTGAGLANYTAHGGFLPKGLSGVLLAACFAYYSFIGVEMTAIASGEAAQPEKTIPRAFRRQVFALSSVYVVTTAILVGVIPWNQMGTAESPFVSVLRQSGIPGTAAVMNFVVLTAALSSANACLYLVARTLFSLSKGGLVPEALGALSSRGVPVNALWVAAVGLALAVLVQTRLGESAYVWFLGVALFGALFCWVMIFVTHIAFRRAWARSGTPAPAYQAPFGEAGSAIGAVAMLGVLYGTWWISGLDVSVKAAVPWLGMVGLLYLLTARRGSRTSAHKE
ncbi:MAG: amino acid permease [Vicinamibacterales bacterium]